MKILSAIVFCILLNTGASFAQNDQHLKFYSTCDSIIQFVDNRYNGYDAELRGKMSLALIKKSVSDFSSASNYVPLAVLPQVSKPQAQYLLEKYNIPSYEATESVLLDFRTRMLDSICFANMLVKYGKNIFEEMPPAPAKPAKIEQAKPQEQSKTLTRQKATVPTAVVEPVEPVSSIVIDPTAIKMPTINRVTEVRPYLKRKFALDGTKIEPGDFIILVFDKAGRLTDSKVISVDMPEEGETERLSPYLKTQAPKIKALIKKFGWRGPTQNGKYLSAKVVVSLSDYSIRIL
jgi:hypothetical protein